MQELEGRLRDVVAVARRFCDQIERAAASPDIDFLRGLLTTLPELYWRGQLLPDIDPWEGEEDDDEEEESETDVDVSPTDLSKNPRRDGHMARLFETRDKLAVILQGRDYHRLVFDPYSADNSTRDAVTASLSDHLASIYSDLRDLFDQEQEQTSLEWNWHWRFDMNSHWGRLHLLPALNAIDWLVHSHWDEYEDEWQETWTPPGGADSCPS